MGRFGKRDDLVVHQYEPFNAETGLASLTDAVTDTDAFYVRGHGLVPEIDPGVWRLQVHGMVERELSLSLKTLREAFRERVHGDAPLIAACGLAFAAKIRGHGPANAKPQATNL